MGPKSRVVGMGSLSYVTVPPGVGPKMRSWLADSRFSLVACLSRYLFFRFPTLLA